MGTQPGDAGCDRPALLTAAASAADPGGRLGSKEELRRR